MNPPTSVCGARTRRAGTCLKYPCRNGRCPLHGGRSTGPRTASGRRKCAEVNVTHGRRTKDAVAERQRNLAFLRQCDDFLAELDE